jgi:hypothetical protein
MDLEEALNCVEPEARKLMKMCILLMLKNKDRKPKLLSHVLMVEYMLNELFTNKQELSIALSKRAEKNISVELIEAWLSGTKIPHNRIINDAIEDELNSFLS